MASPTESWPELPYEAWKDTYATLHMWTQIVGKIRLVQTPWLNHSWHVVLYVTPRGLTTSPIPYGERSFELDFDFIDHVLVASTERRRGRGASALSAHCGRFLCATSCDPWPSSASTSASTNCPTRFLNRSASARTAPMPLTTPIRPALLADAAAVEPRAVALPHRASSARCSPVHFFWGSFDLAVTRFSGRRAPLHPGGVPHLPDAVAHEAYSHEVSSAGFWPGNEMIAVPGLLLLCLSGAAGFRRSASPPGARRSTAATSANISCPTRRCAPPPIQSAR